MILYHGTCAITPDTILKEGIVFKRHQDYLDDAEKLISAKLGYLPAGWEAGAREYYADYRKRHRLGLYLATSKALAKSYATFGFGGEQQVRWQTMPFVGLASRTYIYLWISLQSL